MKCRASTVSERPCGHPATKIVTVFRTDYPMCTRHANRTREQMNNPELLIPVSVSISEIPDAPPDTSMQSEPDSGE